MPAADSMQMKLKKDARFFVAIIVSFITFLLYVPSLQNGFVNWDDDLYVYDNPGIRKLDLQFLFQAFSEFHASGNWHPLTLISHAMDYAVWGLNPLGHHLTNNLLHAINTFLVILLVVRLLETAKPFTVGDAPALVRTQADSAERTDQSATGAPYFTLIAAGITGLLFGIHPLHVESVAWVSERKDVLCALFFLCSIMSYIKYANADNGLGKKRSASRFFNRYYLAALGCFALASLSKPMAVTLPVVLLLLDWYPLRRTSSAEKISPVFVEKIPFFALSLLLSVITIFAQSSGKAIVPFDAQPLAFRVLIGARAMYSYLLKMIFPLDLVPFYPYPRMISFLSFEYLLPVFLVVVITAASIAVAKRQRIFLAVWIYFFVTLLPVLGIVQVGAQSMADRYTYLPSLGPFLLAGLGAAWVFKKGNSFQKQGMFTLLSSAGMAVILFFLSYATIQQIGVWKNSLRLWDYVIEKSVQKVPFAYYNRGLAYGEKGFFDLAVEDFSRAITISPKFNMAYNNRGVAYFFKKEYSKALEDFNKAVFLDRNNAEAYINRGYVYLKTGNMSLALLDLKTGCDLGKKEGCKALQAFQGPITY